MSQTDSVRLDLTELSLAEGDNRGWVQLARTTDGPESHGTQKFEITADDLAAYAAEIKSRPGRIPIDRDHSFEEGRGTAAAGWIDSSSVELRGDGKELWAQVDWTPAAAQEIRDGVYRYISPEISFQSLKDGVMRKAKQFRAAALTNRPHFKDMAPVTLTEDDDQEVTVSDYLITLKKSLGLPDEADEATVTAALAAKDEQIAALEAEKLELSKRPALAESDLKTLIASAAKGEQAAKDLHDMRREAILSEAVAKGKILPVQRDAFATMFDSDAENIVKLLDATPEKSFSAKGTGGAGDDEPTVDATDYKGLQEDEVLILADEAAAVSANLAERNIANPTTEQYLESVKLVRAKKATNAA